MEDTKKIWNFKKIDKETQKNNNNNDNELTILTLNLAVQLKVEEAGSVES